MYYESVISEIFNEAECRAANIILKGERYTEANKEMDKAKQALLNSFSKDQNELFEEYESTRSDVQAIEDTEIFRYGVSFGVKFIIEAILLDDKNDM